MAEEAELIKEIDLSGFGGISEAFVIPEKKGPPGILCLQTAGIFMSSIYPQMIRGMYGEGFKGYLSKVIKSLNITIPSLYPFHYLNKADRDLFCMTMTNWEGIQKWQFGKVNHDKYYCSHQGESLVDYADLNNDGVDELVTIFAPGRLGVFSVESGRLLNECKLPSDNFSLVRIAKTGLDETNWTILAGVTEAAYPPHTYGNPLVLLDNDLNILAEYDIPYGLGHTVLVFDADGDGFEEFLAGYTLLDHNGKIIWAAEGLEKCDSYLEAARKHADCSIIIDPTSKGQWKVAIAGSDRLYLFNNQGIKLWECEAIHSQYVLLGKFDKNSRCDYLFHLQCRQKMELLDIDGRQLWEGKLPANWPGGRPAAVPNDDCFHMGSPASVWHDPLENGNDLIIYNEAGWPYAVNGYGELCVTFRCTESTKEDIRKSIPKNHRPDDFGYGYRCLVLDLDLDSKEEVIIYNRNRAWIYKLT
ncbi:MAG: hypothetical protein ABSH06_04595 [Thermodesulfobacteriota bacterium]